jgi:response regulator RpfG family c-di-GMP phosphodiesterase
MANKIRKLEININETSLGQVIEEKIPRIINDLKEHTKNKPIGKYNELLIKAGLKSSIAYPLVIDDQAVGIIFFSNQYKNMYTEEHLKLNGLISESVANSIEKNIYVEDLIYSSIIGLAKLAESRDTDTGKHLQRISHYSRFIADRLQEDNEFEEYITDSLIDGIERFSPLHDIGKVRIRDSILLKPGKLTSSEFEIMKRHAVYGAEVLQAAEDNLAIHGKSIFRLGIEIAKGHHEKWNGTGYPSLLKGKEIPLSARIVAIADVFDALTSTRPYKEAYSFEVSFKMLLEESGQHFDPTIMDILEKNRSAFYTLYKDLNCTDKYQV